MSSTKSSVGKGYKNATAFERTMTTPQKRKRTAPSTPIGSKRAAVAEHIHEQDGTTVKKRKQERGSATKSVSKALPKQESPSKKSKDSPTKPPREKRPRHHRSHPPQSYLEKLHRAQTQRMFVIDRTPGGTPECPEETIAVAGTTGNIYDIHISRVPSCTCPDHVKGNQCKHIVYVLHNILKAPEDLQYQLGFLSTELQNIFKSAPSPIASATSSSEGNEEAGGLKQRAIEGDCPICFMPFKEPGSDPEIVYCRAACGNNIHADCFEQWAKSQAGKEVRCVYCRTKWQGDEEQILRIVKQKIKSGLDGKGQTDMNGEGYVNVASELGLSGARGELFHVPVSNVDWWPVGRWASMEQETHTYSEQIIRPIISNGSDDREWVTIEAVLK